MDRVSKFLKKLSPKDLGAVDIIVSQVLSHDFSGLNVKKLKGKHKEFRVRKGDIRIIFLMDNDSIKILSIERKSDNTYK